MFFSQRTNADKKISRRSKIYIAIFLPYVVICAGLSYTLSPSNIYDFVQAYKAFIYVIPLSFFCNRFIFSERSLISLLKILTIFFLIKYGYSRALDLTHRLGDRPGLYTENNYELIFLLMLYLSAARAIKRPATYVALISIIVFLSASRSAAMALVVVFAFTYFDKVNAKSIISCMAMTVLIYIMSLVFIERMGGGIEDIDRFKFLMVFIDETKNWSIYRFLAGAPPLTALSSSACASLSYYQTLFSFSGDGSCYSVILHSYILRVVFDHGVVGFLMLLAFLWDSLNKSGSTKREILCIYGILISSALSVSSFNSIYVAIGLALMLGRASPPNTIQRSNVTST